MTSGALSARWYYDLGQRKIYEFRSALGLPGEGPAPTSAVFAYGIVPGIARVLTDPAVAAHREDLRLTRVEAVFASELDMKGELACSIDFQAAADVVAVVACEDRRGARAVATIHLTQDDRYVPPERLSGAEPLDRLRLDPARCIAFAASTWDLNPAYWDREFAQLVGLERPVAPPGLVFALAAASLERRAGRTSTSLDAEFVRAARSGDGLELRAAGRPEDVEFEVVSGDGVVLRGKAVLGRGQDRSVTS